MNKNDFRKAINIFDLEMKILNFKYKYLYDDNERKEIFRLCRKITRYSVPESKDGRIPVSADSIRNFSIRSLKIFENQNIVDFFEEKTSNIKIVRDRNKKSGEAGLEWERTSAGNMHYVMFLPKGNLCVTDQLSYSHEIGHIPELDLIRESYLEYGEALPIFFEYICELKRHGNHNDALDCFLYERLPMEREDALDVMKIYKNIELPAEDLRLYHLQLFADYYSYLESTEFALQLIDRMKDDRLAVGCEIEKIINGKSMIETAKELDINTGGCERLLKEYKRLSR